MTPCSSPCHGCHPEALGSRQGSELMVAFSSQVEPCHVEKAVSRMWAVGESVQHDTPGEDYLYQTGLGFKGPFANFRFCWMIS